ncbi:MAG: protein-methionine-sulfoxide reductase catalytic subunit MsrP [Methylomonas sp.]
MIKSKHPIAASEITDSLVFTQRRQIIKALGLSTLGLSTGINNVFANSQITEKLTPTSVDIFKNYTNYYEFSFNKEDSTQLAKNFPTNPWQLEISGEVENPLKLNLEDVLKSQSIQEYIYRFRCVEGWSMVVPWMGFSLANLLKLAKPLSTADFVKFTSVFNPELMPNQLKSNVLTWPYTEGLRIDEATHPLTLLAVGAYGNTLPKQNGAPLRLVVPWKYGFKSIKAIVKIELLKRAPLTSWNSSAPNEYGFYANVNPNVPHPRWSQNSERLLGAGFFTARRETELFNGYGDQVASLYKNMDLRHFF